MPLPQSHSDCTVENAYTDMKHGRTCMSETDQIDAYMHELEYETTPVGLSDA